MKIVVFPNFLDEASINFSKDVCLEILKYNLKCYICNDNVELLKKYGFQGDYVSSIDNSFDVAIAIGGDGTTLKVAKLAAEHSVATLGINAGTLGFMSGVEKNELHLLQKLVNGDFHTEKRMMLQTKIVNGDIVQVYNCLNDAVISRGNIARLIDVEIYCKDQFVTKSRGDGLIVSTPTGSTAYSMAAGGPILSPENSNFVVTPICPHSLVNRSIIFSSNEILKLKVSSTNNTSHSFVSIDGNESITINNETIIEITKSDHYVDLIKIKPDNFYEILNKKLIERR